MKEGQTQTIVTCRDLTAGYGETAILEGIDLEIYRGQITVLLGGSGSGKSTLMKTLTGLLPPIDGEVELLGQTIDRTEPEQRPELLRRTGILFQHGALFSSQTVYENISLPLREHTNLPEEVIRQMVRMRLATVGLHGIEKKFPSQLSGGQQKRVALARATITDPEIVFADEPSAGLDPIVAAGLDKLLRQLQKFFNMTMIVVTHELHSIRLIADRVVMLKDGGISAVGTVEELEQSDDPNVREFFDRTAPDYVDRDKMTSVLDVFSN